MAVLNEHLGQHRRDMAVENHGANSLWHHSVNGRRQNMSPIQQHVKFVWIGNLEPVEGIFSKGKF